MTDNLGSRALEHVVTAYQIQEPDWDDLPDYDIDELEKLSSYADAVVRAARSFKAEAAERIAAKLGKGTGIGVWVGDHFVREGQGYEWKLKEPEAAAQFIKDEDWRDVVNVKAKGAITMSRLVAYAQRRAAEDVEGIELDEESLRSVEQTAKDTFFEREPTGGPVTITPRDRVQLKGALKLEDGQYYVPRGVDASHLPTGKELSK